MALLLRPLPCPHCQRPINKPILKEHGLLSDFLKSKPLPCPHCDAKVIYPEKADTLLSVGLMVAAIVAPLFHYWQVEFLDAKWVFALGAAMTVAGIFTQKLAKADT